MNPKESPPGRFPYPTGVVSAQTTVRSLCPAACFTGTGWKIWVRVAHCRAKTQDGGIDFCKSLSQPLIPQTRSRNGPSAVVITSAAEAIKSPGENEPFRSEQGA